MKNQSGNILFLILIAVALFAALSYAVTSSTRSGDGTVSKEKSVAEASAILQYAATLKSAVLRVKMSNGCTDFSLDFSNIVYTMRNGTPYMTANSGAPASKICHIFNALGAGIQPVVTSVAAMDTSTYIPPTGLKLGHPSITIQQLKGVGTDGVPGTESVNDVVFSIDQLNKTTCIAINNILGISNPGGNPPIVNYNGGSNLVYDANNFTATSTFSHATTDGSPAYCRNTGNSYALMYALVER